MDLGCWFANLGGKFDALAFSNSFLSIFFFFFGKLALAMHFLGFHGFWLRVKSGRWALANCMFN